MDFCKEDSALYNNPLVIAEINALAATVKMNLSIDEGNPLQDGNPVTLDLDTLVNLLLQQIIGCVPRDKQKSILYAHGLDSYCEELDKMWSEFVSSNINS